MRIWIIAATSLALFTAACGETKTQRVTTGAAGGAVLGAVLGGPIGAVKEFQASRDGLPYTGTLDARTLQEIRTVAAAKSAPANEEKTRPTGTTQSPDTREAAAARKSPVD
jgi:hypothetical protein